MEISEQTLSEMSAHHFITEASEVGLPPGSFPTTFTVRPHFGNGLSFQLTHRLPDGGCAYRQMNGCVTIHILND